MTQPQPTAVALPCVQCAYDLRATDTTSRCPECGLIVAATLAHHRSELFHPRLLRRLTWGFVLLLLGSLLTILLLLFYIFQLVQNTHFMFSGVLAEFAYYLDNNRLAGAMLRVADWVPTLILVAANLLLTARLTQRAPSFWHRFSLWYLRLYQPGLILWCIIWYIAIAIYSRKAGPLSLSSPFYIAYIYVNPLLIGVVTLLGIWALLYRLGYLEHTIPILKAGGWARALRLRTAVVCLLPVAAQVLYTLVMQITLPGHCVPFGAELSSRFPYSSDWILIAHRAASLPALICILTLSTIYLIRLHTVRAQNHARWRLAQKAQ
jgi:hypothetical protein